MFLDLDQQATPRAREDAISCKDSQLITPSVSAVAIRNGLTTGGYVQRTHLDVITLAAGGRSQPRRSQLTNGRIGIAAGAIIPPVLELPQVTWQHSSRRWLRRRSPVHSKSS